MISYYHYVLLSVAGSGKREAGRGWAWAGRRRIEDRRGGKRVPYKKKDEDCEVEGL